MTKEEWMIESKNRRPREEIASVRQFVELAVTAGRKYQSAQTRFLHYNEAIMDETVHETIPLYENFLFALALIRLPLQVNVADGKNLLERLIAFQIPSGDQKGNFPKLLQDYPVSFNPHTAIQILVPLYWLLMEQKEVVGNELVKKIEGVVQNSLIYLENTDFGSSPFAMRLKRCALLVAFGRYFKNEERVKKIDKDLSELIKETYANDFGGWLVPESIGETCLALRLIYSKLSDSPWSHFLDILQRSWDFNARCYGGPALNLLYVKEEPMVTLYDLFLSEMTNSLPYRIFEPEISLLQGSVAYSFEDVLKPPQYPFEYEGEVRGLRYLGVKNETYGFSAIEFQELLPPHLKKGFHSFLLTFGDQMKSHSLSCQGGVVSAMQCKKSTDVIELFFWITDEPKPEDKEKSMELTFYVDQSEDIKIDLEGKKATTFQLNDLIEIASPKMKLAMRFSLENGDARYMGHLMPANRIARKPLFGEQRFLTFDTMLGLRVIRRKGPVCLRVAIQFLAV